jgi:hypothetical protein
VVADRAVTTEPVNGGIANGTGALAFTTAPINAGIVNGMGTLAFTTVPLNGGICKPGIVDSGRISVTGDLTPWSAANAGAPVSTAHNTPTTTRIVAMLTEWFSATRDRARY